LYKKAKSLKVVKPVKAIRMIRKELASFERRMFVGHPG